MDATTALEEGTLSESDESQLRYAAENGWPLLTFDDDFLSLVTSGSIDVEHAGVVYISQYRKDVGEIVRRVDASLQRRSRDDVAGDVIFA